MNGKVKLYIPGGTPRFIISSRALPFPSFLLLPFLSFLLLPFRPLPPFSSGWVSSIYALALGELLRVLERCAGGLWGLINEVWRGDVDEGEVDDGVGRRWGGDGCMGRNGIRMGISTYI